MALTSSDSQFQLDFTPCLGGTTLESLQEGRDFCLAILLRLPNGVRLVNSWSPQIHLPSRRNPPLDGVKATITGGIPEWRVSLIVGLVHVDSGVLQHLTNTRELRQNEGSVPILFLHINVDLGMRQEDGDNGVMAIAAGVVKGGLI